jgi:2-polyprenyl-6-methoxyphenol hydroxylase-like FAD-dependent oxidoreductase
MRSIPVCIVGGGPVGMNLALNLNALGVRSILVNTDPETLQQPRGSTQNSRTMEHYRRLGLARDIRKLGLPPDNPTDVTYSTRTNGWELARISMPSESEKMRRVHAAPTTDQVPEPILRCNQMYVESYLLTHLKTVANVELRFGSRCLDWTEQPDGVTVQIEDLASGALETISCSYLVGCDGGQSFVRRKLGIHYSGEAGAKNLAYLSGMMVSTHLFCPDFFKLFAGILGWQQWTVNASLRCNMVILNGRDELILLSQLPSIDRKPDDSLISQRFVSAVGQPVDFKILGHWTWTPGRALVADSYGRGRVVLAGDSVHLFTPTGGFGMNTGVDDVANLAWKLAALVQGWGGSKLLASFEAERRPIGIRNTSAAKYFSRNVGSLPVASEIEEDSERGALAREETGRILQTFTEEFASLGIQLGARYDGSPIVIADGTAPPPDDPFKYIPSACPGGRAPHAWLPDRTSLFDHFGPGFTLLLLPGRSDDGEAIAAAALKNNIPLTRYHVDLPEIRDLYGAGMALIRPDQHVAWRGDGSPEQPAATLRTVIGH